MRQPARDLSSAGLGKRTACQKSFRLAGEIFQMVQATLKIVTLPLVIKTSGSMVKLEPGFSTPYPLGYCRRRDRWFCVRGVA
jgi:hypothetical protein